MMFHMFHLGLECLHGDLQIYADLEAQFIFTRLANNSIHTDNYCRTRTAVQQSTPTKL